MTEYQRRMDATLRLAQTYAVPVELIMRRDMLGNWRRRVKRLDRAQIRAALDGHHARTRAIAAARHRLATGRLHP